MLRAAEAPHLTDDLVSEAYRERVSLVRPAPTLVSGNEETVFLREPQPGHNWDRSQGWVYLRLGRVGLVSFQGTRGILLGWKLV